MRTALTLLLCLCLSLAALSQPSQPAKDVLATLEHCYTLFDWTGAIGAVEKDPAVSLELGRWLVTRLESQEKDVPQHWQFFACFIARVLERSHQAGDLPALIAAKELTLPESTWERSPLAAKPIENLVTAQELADLAPDLDQAEELARMGNYEQAFGLINPLMDKVRDYGYSGQEFTPELVKLTARCQCLRFGMAELRLEIPAEKLDLELQRARQAESPESESFMAMLSVSSAGRRERGAEIGPRLARARQVIQGGLPAFVVETWSAAREQLMVRPDLPIGELTRLHDNAWKHFQLPDKEALPLTFTYASEAAGVWIRALGARREPEAARLLESDLSRIEDLTRKAARAEQLEAVLTLSGVLLDAAELSLDQGRLDEAEQRLDRALLPAAGLFESLKDANAPETVLQGHPSHMAGRWHLLRLRLASLRGEDADALGSWAGHALEALRLNAKSNPMAEVELYVGLGEVDLPGLDLADAQGFMLEMAVGVYESPTLYDRPRLTRALIARGRWQARQGQTADAIATLTKATSLIEETVNELGASPGASQLMRERYRPAYELLARLQLAQKQPQEAFETLARMQQAQAVTNLRSGDVAPHKEGVALEQERQQMAAARLLPPGPLKTQLLASTRQEFLTTLRQLDQANEGYRLLAVRPVEFGRIQQSIPEDTAVIQLFPSDKSLYLFIATRESLQVREVQIARSELEELVKAFRASVARQSRRGSGFDWDSAEGEQLTETLSRLYAALVAPIEADVAGKRVLAFIPTDDLAYLPLASLGRVKDGKLRFLAEDHPVVTLVSSADLTQLSNAPQDSRGSLLALGNPDGSLPAAQAEVKELEQFFPSAQVFVGSQAGWARLASAASRPLGCLHLATHGVLNSANPLESYLVLAGKPDRIKLSDVAGLELSQVGLVTLSACQTAVADRNLDLGQEVFSLSQGFGYAGVRSVMASLWKVDDAATRALMTAFYGSLARGKSRADALQEAQLAVLSQAGYRHPFYWSSFVLMGDWR